MFTLRESPTTNLSSDMIGINRIGDTEVLPGARFIFEAVDAAKPLLTTVNNYLPPGQLSIVSLFGAHCICSFNAATWIARLLSAPEKASVRRLITDTIARLHEGGGQASSIGTSYADLLDVLWKRTDVAKDSDLPTSTFEEHSRQSLPVQERQPWFNSGFSWLDLEAIIDFVWGDTSWFDDLDFNNTQVPMDGSFGDNYWNCMPLQSDNDALRGF
ncbi:hypothetical protein BDV12DRAFT_192293 [Aspergillus spectabilis]